MSLTLEEVKSIANLARLRMTPEELESYRAQLSEILEYFDFLNKLDTSEVPSDPSYIKVINKPRIDEPMPGFTLKDLIQNAAQVDEEQFSVPPVFD
jgi:aspartyl-tRNA(Asn)/glutamyl-tRNA(Gln) amidotransferase subunit C